MDRFSAPVTAELDATGTIEAALPRLAEVLKPALDRLCADLQGSPSATGAGPSEPDATPEGPSEDDGRPDREPVELEATVADLLARRTVALLAIPLTDVEVRARVALELARLLGGGRSDPLPEEGALLDAARAASRDPAQADVLPGRLAHAAQSAVNHVLLGGPGPDEVDHAPEPGETHVLSRRALAFVLDMMVAMVIVFVLSLTFARAGSELTPGSERLLGYLGLALGALINVRLIASTGTTLGKATMGIRVERAIGGSTPDFVMALRREFIGRFMNQVFFCIGTLAAVVDSMRQTWGDRWAGTVVVRSRHPVRWRPWAILATSLATLVSITVIPGLVRLGELEDELFPGQDDVTVDLVTLTDSLITLATREVENDEEMERDLSGILELAPRVRRQATEAARLSTLYVRQARWFAPWVSGIASRRDSTHRMVNRCAGSAEMFAIHMQEARVPTADTTLTRSRRLAADFELSDLLADRQAIRELWRGVASDADPPNPEGGDE